MIKRPKVDSEALNRILPDTGSFAAQKNQPDQAAKKGIADDHDLIQKITALKALVDKLSGLVETAEFKQLTCRNIR